MWWWKVVGHREGEEDVISLCLSSDVLKIMEAMIALGYSNISIRKGVKVSGIWYPNNEEV